MSELKISNKLLNDIVDMEFSVLSKNKLFKNVKFPKSDLKKGLKAFILESLKSGAFSYFYKNNKLQGYFLFTKTNIAPNLPMIMGLINCNSNKSSLQWLTHQLKENSYILNENSILELPYVQKSILPNLEKLGLYVDTVRLMGKVNECHINLNKETNNTSNFRDHSLKCEKAKIGDLKAITQLERQEFNRNPQYGWFVTHPSWLKQTSNERKDAIKKGAHSLFVIKNKRNKVKGYFGMIPQQVPIFKKIGAPEFVFDYSIQGKGLSNLAYKILLEEMKKKNCTYIVGYTAQMGVFKNAKKMGRLPIKFALRYAKGHFPRNYFLKGIN